MNLLSIDLSKLRVFITGENCFSNVESLSLLGKLLNYSVIHRFS